MFRSDTSGHLEVFVTSIAVELIRYVARNACVRYGIFKAGKYSDMVAIPHDIIYSISKRILTFHEGK